MRQNSWIKCLARRRALHVKLIQRSRKMGVNLFYLSVLCIEWYIQYTYRIQPHYFTEPDSYVPYSGYSVPPHATLERIGCLTSAMIKLNATADCVLCYKMILDSHRKRLRAANNWWIYFIQVKFLVWSFFRYRIRQLQKKIFVIWHEAESLINFI